MKGVTGNVRFTSDRNLIHTAYEVINVIGTDYRRIGYWFSHSGLSILLPETLWAKPPNRSSASQNITRRCLAWTNDTKTPWMVRGPDAITGYCIDVFTAALNLLLYAVPYKLIPFGDDRTNPSGTELVRSITAGVFDAAIGDIAIITNRTKMADFTQPYIESGLVVVAPVRRKKSHAWAFLRPVTLRMWAVTAIFFVLVGTVIWILEHRMNDDFRGPPRRQVVTILWFSFSTWFFAHRENTVSALGRIILIIWLFVVLIINSSYTASLTSILTVQQLTSPIEGIETLVSTTNPIVYQQGSFTRNYLIDELKIHASRLVPLNSPEESAKALEDGPHKGGVAAMVDDRAYIELFLSTRCEFSIVGQEFTKDGWGFAFPRDSHLAVDMSTALLKFSENGGLQRIHDKWLLRRACSYQGAKMEVDRLRLKSFWGLFVICGLACLIALFVYFLKMVRQFSRHYSKEVESSGQSSRSARIQTFLSFVDEKEEVKNRSKRRQMERASNRTEDGSISCSNKRNTSELASSKSLGSSSEV
ncbi:hypothetical protein CRYUN_Cryun24cG0000400 [Craigia yunnanensis]